MVCLDWMGALRHNKAPLSALPVRLLRAANRLDVTIDELSRLCAQDPGFVVRILSVVNSAAFGLSSQVRDIRRAVMLVGSRGVRNLALSLLVNDMAPGGPDGDVLFANCLRRAIVARTLAEHMANLDVNPDESFTVGLLLDSGLLARAREDLNGAAHIARAPAAERVALEQAKGGVPHPASGARIARDWSLGVGVAESIGKHHDDNPGLRPLSRVAWLAESIAGALEGDPADIAHANELGVDGTVLQTVLDRTPEMVAEAERAMGRGPRPEANAGDQGTSS